MSKHLPNVGSPDEAEAGAGTQSRMEMVQLLLDVGLHALRTGTFEDLVRQRPSVARWLVRRHGSIVHATLGDSVRGDVLSLVAALVLRWLIVQLRPDGNTKFDRPGEEAWIRFSGWRPYLAVASCSGLLPIPDYPHQYRRSAGEPPLENLCGLWDVGPSTVYRLLERGRRSMAQNWATQLDGHRCASLRLLVMQHVASELKFAGDGERCAWHAAQALATRNSRDSASTLWHYCRARDPAGVIRTLRRSAGLLAVWPETDELVREADGLECTPHQRVDLWLARAQVERTRRKSSNELFAYEQARRVAQAAEAPLLLGIVHSALGRYYDLRDTDRALSFYQDSVEFLREERSALHNGDALGHFVVALARLAWLYLLRNDGRSKPLLDKAENLRREHSVPTEALGVLEQAWGEYWHRAGNKVRSLEHRYRALNIFERLGDERSIVATQVNIAFDLAVRGERGRAIEALRQTLQAARAGVLEGEQAFVVHLNLGENLCSAGDYEGAIEHGQLALSRSLADGLTLGAFNARYNLAEAHYMRFRDLGNPSDESAGDELVQAALIEPGRDVPPSSLALLRKLKDTVLGVKQLPEPYRLLPREMAIHYQEVDEIERQRLNLAIPTDPESQARAQLAIARAYLIISTKEREAALALIHKHGLQARFAVEFDDLKQAFNRGLTREQQLADGWKQSAADLVDDARRAPLIAHLMREGSINKSRYAQLHGVSLATASKHLGLLTERGLLIQRGKGPSTRYELPK